MEDAPAASIIASPVPLFPLPNVVLFPRAVVPLHIFEERYKAMTADALAGDRQIAMSLLRPGWEKSYYGKPEIEPVVCVGTIVSAEKLPDGNYNFLLQGHTRATIRREVGGRLYRLASLEPLAQTQALEIDFTDHRRRLSELFMNGALGATALGKHFRMMITSPLPTADILDIASFNFLDDVAIKQSLLAEADVHRRVRGAIDALAKLDRLMSLTLRTKDPSVN